MAITHATTQAAAAKHYQVISLEKEFTSFWHKAAGQPFPDQVKAWDDLVERPHQAFYDAFVWNKKANPNWQERKERRLKAMFAKYPELFPAIEANFKTFPATLDHQIGKFREQFKDADFHLPIYAVPSTTFNGKGGEDGTTDGNGQTALAFGIDMATDHRDNPDVLYSHELFHIYHTDAIGVNEAVFTKEGHLTLPLWLEGLATYVSGQFNPAASDAALLMSDDLPKLGAKDVHWLAARFLKQADEKMDQKGQTTYASWFGIGGEKLRPDLPDRCGYFLGLQVVRHLAKANSLNTMVHWKVPEVHAQVVKALEAMSR